MQSSTVEKRANKVVDFEMMIKAIFVTSICKEILGQ